MRTKRPSKFNSSPYGRSSIDIGGIIGAVGGGEGAGAAVETDTAAIADVASKTPFSDKNFDVDEVQRFKPKNPVRNFLSGGKGTSRANELNTESQLNESDTLASRNTLEIDNQLKKDYLEFSSKLGLDTKGKEIDLTNRKAREQTNINEDQKGQTARSFINNNPHIKTGINLYGPLNNQEYIRQLEFGLGSKLGGGLTGAANLTGKEAVENKSNELIRNFQDTPKFKSAIESDTEEKLLAQKVVNDANARFTSVPNTATFLRNGNVIEAPRVGYDLVPQGVDPLTGLERPPVKMETMKGGWRERKFGSVGKIDTENPDEPGAVNPNEPFATTDSPSAAPRTAKVPRSTTLQAPSKAGFWNTLGNAMLPADARSPKSPVLESQEEKRRKLLEASRGFFRGGN